MAKTDIIIITRRAYINILTIDVNVEFLNLSMSSISKNISTATFRCEVQYQFDVKPTKTETKQKSNWTATCRLLGVLKNTISPIGVAYFGFY